MHRTPVKKVVLENVLDANDTLADANRDAFDRWQVWPRPLHDVATARAAAGFNPLATEPRLPGEDRPHHPMADARQSARLFIEALTATSAARMGKGV